MEVAQFGGRDETQLLVKQILELLQDLQRPGLITRSVFRQRNGAGQGLRGGLFCVKRPEAHPVRACGPCALQSSER